MAIVDLRKARLHVEGVVANVASDLLSPIVGAFVDTQRVSRVHLLLIHQVCPC